MKLAMMLVHVFLVRLFQNWMVTNQKHSLTRGGFWTIKTSKMELFAKRIIYFRKKVSLRRLTRFWIRLWQERIVFTCFNFRNTEEMVRNTINCHWNCPKLKTVVSTSFQRGIHVVCCRAPWLKQEVNLIDNLTGIYCSKSPVETPTQCVKFDVALASFWCFPRWLGIIMKIHCCDGVTLKIYLNHNF